MTFHLVRNPTYLGTKKRILRLLSYSKFWYYNLVQLVCRSGVWPKRALKPRASVHIKFSRYNSAIFSHCLLSSYLQMPFTANTLLSEVSNSWIMEYKQNIVNKKVLTPIKTFVFFRLSGCPDPCQCNYIKGTHSLLSVLCVTKKLKSFPWTLPLATAALLVRPSCS